MSSDDRFDDLLQEAAREHNSAPETPRADMWAAIAAARAGRTPDSAAEPPGRPGVPAVRVIPLHRRHRRALAWVSALAATLLVGVMLGRSSTTSEGAPNGGSAVVASGGPAATEPGAPSGRANGAPANGGPGDWVPNVAANPATAATNGPVGGRNTTRAIAPNVSGAAPSSAGRAAQQAMRGPTRNTLPNRDAAIEAALPYRLAAMQHLVTTEALLVSLRSDLRTGRKDTTIAAWAGDLLGTTRVLIDSPAGRDPQLKQLLEDLELVLAQISRLPGAHGEAADLGLIDDAVRHREIMTRLRALSPNT